MEATGSCGGPTLSHPRNSTGALTAPIRRSTGRHRPIRSEASGPNHVVEDSDRSGSHQRKSGARPRSVTRASAAGRWRCSALVARGRLAYDGHMSESTTPQPGDGVPTAEMLDLDRPECLRLLAGGTVGRIAVNTGDWPHPVLRPVNYVFDESSQSVLIRSDRGSKLWAVVRSTEAAFEIDGFDPVGRVGWSVLVHGITEEITNPRDIERIETLGLEPWAPGSKDHWIRIRSNSVSGRRIVRPDLQG